MTITIRDLLVIEELCIHGKVQPHGLMTIRCQGAKTRSANLDDLDSLLDGGWMLSEAKESS